MEAPIRKIRIGEAAAAISTTSKALRYWISRYADKGVKLTAEQTDGWREFNWGDVAALSITKYLVDLGMSAHAAFAVAMAIVKKRWPDLFSVDDPKWLFSFENSHMFFFFDRNENWQFGSFERAEAPGGVIPPDSRAHIILAVGGIVGDAFNALKEMGHALPECDMAEFSRSLSDEQRRRANEDGRKIVEIGSARSTGQKGK